MKRKTISVDRVKEMVNDMLLNSTDDRKEGRVSLTVLIENVLHETGQYNGFMYLDAKDMERSRCGMSVGIHSKASEGNKFKNVDHTRVRYF